MKNKCIVGYWHYGVILTYLSVISAIIGICFSAMGKPAYGVVCLLVSGLCDAFDGIVAKTRKNRTDKDKSFGGQIDSLSDMIAFGIAPVMIGFGMGMRKWYYIAVFCIFVLCALIRLAYYNVTEEIRVQENGGARTSFEGLPVTNIAVGLPVFYLVATMFHSPRIDISLATELIMTACYLIAATLFVVRFRMPKARARGLIITIVILTVLLTALFLLRYYYFGLHHI